MKKWLTQFILGVARKRGAVVVKTESPIYSDEHIERCAVLYRDNPQIRARGVLFPFFLAYPEAIMRAVIGDSALPLPNDDTYYPLLPAQARVQSRLDDEELDHQVRAQIAELDRLFYGQRMRVSNGAAIEPMHHKTWPRHCDKRLAVDAYGVPLGEEAGAL